MIQLFQKQDEQKCLLYCAAMILEIGVNTLENMLSATGMEEWWPDRYGNQKFRGVHIQEIQDVFMFYGKALIPIEQFPYLAPVDDPRLAKEVFRKEMAPLRFYNHIIGHEGILIYQSHAKVIDIYGTIYDPSSKAISQITPEKVVGCREIWLVGEIKSL